MPGGTAQGLSYEVGSGTLLDGIDDAVLGASSGDARTFQTQLVAGELEGKTADVAVTVRSVNERTLPELDDEWAADAAGFATLEELKGDVRTRLDRVKRLQQGVDARDKVLEALLAKIDIPLPESVLAAELDWRTQTTEDQLTRAGQTMEAFLVEQGKTAEEWDAELKQGAEQAVKAQLVLDAVADAEELEITDAELNDQLVRRAARAGHGSAGLRQPDRPERPAGRPGLRGPPRQGARHRHGAGDHQGRLRQHRRPRAAARRHEPRSPRSRPTTTAARTTCTATAPCTTSTRTSRAQPLATVPGPPDGRPSLGAAASQLATARTFAYGAVRLRRRLSPTAKSARNASARR